MKTSDAVVDVPTTLDLRGQLPHEQESSLLAVFDSLPVGDAVQVVSDGLLGLLHLRLEEVRAGQGRWLAEPPERPGDTCARLIRVRARTGDSCTARAGSGED